MNISVIGTGYVGLVAGACLSEMGNMVTCVDNDGKKIECLKNGKLPIHEPGLDEILLNNYRENRLRFTTSLTEAMSDSNIHIIAVGTPSTGGGSADLQGVLGIARDLGKHMTGHSTIVNKSTVPVGTGEKVKAAIQAELDKRHLNIGFDVVSNPEFLKQGNAVNDFMRPDRVIVGVDAERAAEVMRALYTPFMRNHDRMLVMGIRDAEMTKYAANAMLATRISFINEIANICEQVGVDIENVRKGIGSDTRIGYSFIYPGCGYGGSCLSKDIKALIHMAQEVGLKPIVLQSIESRNEAQKQLLYKKITGRFDNNLSRYTFGLWGLAFKPGTDDIREAPSVVLMNQLIGAGAKVKAYDPTAMDIARKTLPREWFESGRLIFAEHEYEALQDADAMVLVTEWKPFRNPDLDLMKKVMKQPIIFDGRNQYDPKRLKAEGFEYFGIGR